MIKNFDLFLKLNESIEYGIISISVFTRNRNDSIEFEDFLHKNNYTWTTGSEYIIRNANYKQILFIKINNKEKTFSAYDIYEQNDSFIDSIILNNMGKDVLRLEYPKDFRIIKNNLGLIPSYEPKKILK
ncbi:MAG: hypothetical protein ACOC2W_04645 [bacterium]